MATSAPVAFQPSFFIRIDADGTITLTIHRSEMGQGIRTAFAMILAEELEVDLPDVRLEQAPSNDATNQVTSGSGSVSITHDELRAAGGVAREVLRAAAAATWGVDVAACRAEHGTVINTASDEVLTYGELAGLAATLDLPAPPKPKDTADFRLIGSSPPRVDGPAIVDGTAVYGSDVRLPGLRFASVERSPVAGGTVASFDDTAARATPGVVDVVELGSGVAVVAETTWAAMQGRAALSVTFDDGDNARWSSASIGTALADLVEAMKPDDGSALDGLTMIEATYTTPHLAHAAIEPVSCTAYVRADACDIWSSTQNPQGVRDFVSDAVGVPTTVHVTLIGGGFGRRLEVDDAVEAAQISKAIGGPVQVIWTRQDDMRHDFYRPPTHHWMRAAWSSDGGVRLWRHMVAAPGINGVAYQGGRDLLIEGLAARYVFGDQQTDASVAFDVTLPTGPWRSVMNGPNAFANECFFDEVADALGRDPYELRMALMLTDDPLRPLLEQVATSAGWGSALPTGRGRGIAGHTTFDQTSVAMVAEVTVDGDGVRVDRVVCAVDCGLVIHPGMVVQQMEGGIVYGLTALLHGEITYDAGRVQQQSFVDYPLLQMREMPDIEVHLVPSDRPPQGVGEMAVPPITPAVLNAVFAATGRRIRHTPIRAGDLTE